MSSHDFYLNLRDLTADGRARNRLRPAGYLVSPVYATASVRTLAGSLPRDRYKLFADNGNFTIAGAVCKKYSPQTRELLREVDQIRIANKRYIRREDIPQALRKKLQLLARAIQEDAAASLAARGDALPRQLAISPTHLIAGEDLSMAAWLSLSLEPQYLGYRPSVYARLNEAVARRAKTLADRVPSALAERTYSVASAVDYRSAHDAGKLFAEHGIDAVAMGFGAYMADDNSSDHVELPGGRLFLGVSVPNRYTRTTLVARGFWDGYRSVRQRGPKRFHFLGLGAPIMMAIVSLCGYGTSELTFDSTSPIKDAVEGTMYFAEPSYLKSRTRSLAFRLATDPRERWRCRCPFCSDFLRRHPFDRPAASAWLTRSKARDVAAADLRPGGALFDALPLLAEPSSGAARRDVDFARIGHNHWTLMRITRELNAHAASRAQMRTFVDSVARSYIETTNSPHFAKAIELGNALATRPLNV